MASCPRAGLRLSPGASRKKGDLRTGLGRCPSIPPALTYVLPTHKRRLFGAKKTGMTWYGLSMGSAFFDVQGITGWGCTWKAFGLGYSRNHDRQHLGGVPLMFHDCAYLNIWLYFCSCIVKSLMTWSSFSSCIKPRIVLTLSMGTSRFNK